MEIRAPYRALLGRAVDLFFVLFLAWFAGSPFREWVGLGAALLVWAGFFEELRPVGYDRGVLVRGGERRPVREVRSLRGLVVLGVWPRIELGFSDGGRWWLPVAPNWYLLWDRLRADNPRLPDWRKGPLCLYFLARARKPDGLAAVPGELVELAEALGVPEFTPGFFPTLLGGLALAGLLGYWAPGFSNAASTALVGLLGGFAVRAYASLRGMRRLRVYQEEGRCGGGG